MPPRKGSIFRPPREIRFDVKHIAVELSKPEAKRDLASCKAKVEACFTSQDFIEGRTAFMEKRKAQFKGK